MVLMNNLIQSIHSDDFLEGLEIGLECEGTSGALPEEPARRSS